jgi:hypothetical protein
MSRLMVAGAVVVIALGMAVGVWAEEAAIPWATGTAATTPAATSTDAVVAPVATPTGGDAASPLATDPRFAKVVKSVEEQLAAAAKLQGLYDKELAKPEKSRNANLLKGYKTNIAQAYMKAASIAKMQASQFTKPDDKKLITDTYDKPNRDKAVAIYLEQADEAMTKKDYREAISLYKMILSIEPDNQTAKDGLQKIADLMKPNTSPTGTGASGGSTTNTYGRQKAMEQNGIVLPTTDPRAGYRPSPF